MTIQTDILKPETPAYLELFSIDFAGIPGLSGLIYYFTPSSASPITWNGNSYLPWAIQIEGIGMASEGSPIRPTLNIGNLDANKLIGTIVFGYSDIIGAKVTYVRTFETYIGTSISLAPIKLLIGRKLSHNSKTISFELRSPLDKERGFLPHRQALKKDFPGLGLVKSR